MNTSKSILDPWRILLSHLMDLDSYSVPGLVDRTGMVVDWSLTERENYSHKYRRDALRPRIITAYISLPPDDQLRVSHTLAAELSKYGRTDDLYNDIKKIGWTIENDNLVPADSCGERTCYPGSGAQAPRKYPTSHPTSTDHPACGHAGSPCGGSAISAAPKGSRAFPQKISRTYS